MQGGHIMTMAMLRLKAGPLFAQEQVNYVAAKLIYETAYDRAREYDRTVIDTRGRELGLSTPYPDIPASDPVWEQAKALHHAEQSGRELMRSAAHQLFDWAVESVLLKNGSDEQKEQLRAMVDKVKEMAHVEPAWEELVIICMRPEVKAL